MKKLATLAALMAITLSSQAADLYLYAGAGLKEPVEKIVKQFEQNTGNKVTVEYGGSGQILARYNQVKTGDLFLSGSADYVEKLAQDNQVKAVEPLVLHIPVMAVRKDKSANIHSFKDLAESNLRLGIGDAKAMALGKGAEKIFELSGYQQALNEKVVVKSATVKVRDKVEILPNPQGTPQEKVTLALLSSSTHTTEAKQLFDFFHTEGVKYFTDEGFLPVK